MSGGDNGLVGDWLTIFVRHDNRRVYGGVAMTTLLSAGRVRRLNSVLSISPSLGARLSLTSVALTALHRATDRVNVHVLPNSIPTVAANFYQSPWGDLPSPFLRSPTLLPLPFLPLSSLLPSLLPTPKSN